MAPKGSRLRGPRAAKGAALLSAGIQAPAVVLLRAFCWPLSTNELSHYALAHLLLDHRRSQGLDPVASERRGADIA